MRTNKFDFDASKVTRTHKPTKAEEREKYNQLMKAYLKARGIINDKPLKTWFYANETIEAHTKSEARAGFKKKLCLKRLPSGAIVQEVHPL
jgi:hypothetical protein